MKAIKRADKHTDIKITCKGPRKRRELRMVMVCGVSSSRSASHQRRQLCCGCLWRSRAARRSSRSTRARFSASGRNTCSIEIRSLHSIKFCFPTQLSLSMLVSRDWYHFHAVRSRRASLTLSTGTCTPGMGGSNEFMGWDYFSRSAGVSPTSLLHWLLARHWRESEGLSAPYNRATLQHSRNSGNTSPQFTSTSLQGSGGPATAEPSPAGDEVLRTRRIEFRPSCGNVRFVPGRISLRSRKTWNSGRRVVRR